MPLTEKEKNLKKGILITLELNEPTDTEIINVCKAILKDKGVK